MADEEKVYNVDVVFTNLGQMAECLKRDADAFVPVPLVLDKEEYELYLKNFEFNKSKGTKIIEAMAVDPKVKPREEELRKLYNTESGSEFLYYKISGFHFDGSQYFVIVNKKGWEPLLHMKLKGVIEDNMSYNDKEKKFEITISYSERLGVIRFKTSKTASVYDYYNSSYGGYNYEAFFEDEPNEKNKTFRSKKGEVYNQEALLKLMISNTNDFKVAPILKAVKALAEKFSKTSFYVADSSSTSKSSSNKMRLATPKQKDKLWRELIEGYLAFLAYTFEEKPELRMAMEMNRQDEDLFADDSAKESRLGPASNRGRAAKYGSWLRFKASDLYSLGTLTPDILAYLGKSPALMDLLIFGYDLTRAVRIVEAEREDEDFGFRFFMMRERTGEEEKRKMRNFIESVLTTPRDILLFLLRVSKYILDRDYQKVDNVVRTIDFIHKEFIEPYNNQISTALQTNDELRELYFKVAVQLVDLVTKNAAVQVKKQDRIAVELLVTRTVLSSVANLPDEFYKLLFAKCTGLSKEVYRNYFTNDNISKEDKYVALLKILSDPQYITQSFGEFIEDFIVKPYHVPSLTIKDLFFVLQKKYFVDKDSFDSFIKRNKNCNLHRAVLSGINTLYNSYEENDNARFVKSLNVRDDYFFDLYKKVLEGMKAFLSDILIEYLNDANYLNADLVRYLEDFKTRDYAGRRSFTDLVNNYQKRLETIKSNLAKYISVLEKNEKYMQDYNFFRPLLTKLRGYRGRINEFMIIKIETDQEYRECELLKETTWDKYSICQLYVVFFEELKKLCTKDIKFTEYKAKVDDHLDALARRMDGFVKDDKLYTLEKYIYHFRRIMEKDNFEVYDNALNALGMSEKNRYVLFNKSKAFHALNKILKLKESIDTIVTFDFLKLKKTENIKKQDTLNKKFKKAKFEDITYEKLVAADEYKLTTSADFSKCVAYQMPMVIRYIADSKKTFKFIKAKGTDFIRSMREECDSENLDITNKLDVINKNLGFIVNAPDIDSLIEGLIAVPKVEQRKVKKFLSSIEPLIETHIVHLAEKTKKDSEYRKKTIENILADSVIKLRFVAEAKEYVPTATYTIGKASIGVDAIELNEHFNNAKIIAGENQNAIDGEKLDSYFTTIYTFNSLGKELSDLDSSLKHLRNIGLINLKFDDLVEFLNQNAKNKTTFTVDEKDSSILLVRCQQASTSVPENLHQVNEALKLLGEQLSKELYSYYSQECYLFTYFYGKKLFYLIEYLRGRLPKEEQEECLNLIKEAFPDDMIKFKLNKDDVIPKDIKKVFSAVHTVLKRWSGHISAKQKIKFNTSTVFQLKKIVVVVNPVVNKYKMILKVMTEAQENIPSLSQMLFCRPETTKNEILSFCSRALMDPFKRIYIINNIHILEYDLLLHLRDVINDIIKDQSENLNYNLLIFADKTEFHKDLLENENFCRDFTLDSLDKLKTDLDVQNRYSHILFTNQLVMSATAGMGKSNYIKKQTENFDLIELFLAGELNKHTITKRLSNLSLQIREKPNVAISIKLDFIEDFNIFAEMVDYTVFCLSFVRRYYTDKGCMDLTDKLKQVYFEIGNTFSTELLSELDTLRILNVDSKEEKMNIHKYKVIMPPFSLSQVFFNEDPDSDEQTVVRLFNSIEKKSLGAVSLKDDKSVVKEKEFRALITSYFMCGKKPEEKQNVTYAQYQFWLRTISLFVKEFNLVEKLSPDELKKDKLPIGIRNEVASEILMFASQIINLSVGQAKTSQDEMKKILKELAQDKEAARNKRMEEYKNKFVGLEPWDSTDMLVPLFINQKLLLAHTNMDLFNKEGSERFRKRIDMKTYIRSVDTYVENDKNEIKSDSYLKQLAKVLGKGAETDLEDLKKRTREFNGGKGFCLTRDNYMKICLILIKAQLKIPIIMMGESGCGKTYLSQYVSSVLQGEKLKELTLYSGVTEQDFVKFMKSAIEDAKEAEKAGKKVWVFFDEFNTSCLQSIVAEIMLDRKCPIDLNILNIPDNIVFISCCNPYRMKTKKADVGLVPKTTDNLLSHRVYPIPERLINFVWDFGQLSDQDEYIHLKSIIEAENLFAKSRTSDLNRFCNMIYSAHRFVRDLEERSGVSLRDIKRVVTLYKWFQKVLKYYQTEIKNLPSADKLEVHLKSAIASAYVCYGLRLNGRKEQGEFIRILTNSANAVQTLSMLRADQVRNVLSEIAQHHFDGLLAYKAEKIPEGIALNVPLKENFITMLACFDTLTPLIICGAPGTSKTLCTQIFSSALTADVIKNCKTFSQFKGINAMYYGGSQTSTSEGISKVFQRGEKYLDQQGEDRPVVVFDEIGLAELSPYNPLKILHPLLEKVPIRVGFLGLSNWTLDLSKMNRLIYLARPDMTRDDLFEIFKISIKKCQNDTVKKDLEVFLGYLTSAYLRFREWQKKYGSHPNFHGSRDIYGVSKFVYLRMSEIKHYDTTAQARDLIKTAIERNFNGALYMFGGSQHIPVDSVKGLMHGLPEKSELSMIRIKDFGDMYSQNKDRLDSINDLIKPKNDSNEKILAGTEVFKKLFLNEAERDPKIGLFDQNFLTEYPVLELVKQNIQDKNARFLLVKSEGEVIDNIFLEKLREFNKSDKIVDWRGVQGKENSIELLSTLKSYISLGYVVVMKNLDELYGSLYDLFNQKFMEVDGKQYCYLYYGENKHRVEVSPEFKAIVILSAEKELEGLDVELEQPAPFLNRFEKFFLRISNIISQKKIAELINIRNMLKKITRGFSSRYVGLSVDMLASICVTKKDLTNEAGDPDSNVPLSKVDLPGLTDKQSDSLMKLTTLNYLLYDGLTSEQISKFHDSHPYTNLDEALTDITAKPSCKLCLMTFSNPMEIEPIRKDIEGKFNIEILNSEEIFGLGLERRAAIVKNYKSSVFVMQFIYSKHLAMMSQMKACVEQNPKITKTLFLVHLERNPQKREILKSNVGLNYWNDWDNRVLDSILHTPYTEYCETMGLSFERLLLSEQYKTGEILLKECILQSIIDITHESDISLRLNMFNIRNLIEKDEKNTFLTHFRQKLMKTGIFNKDSGSWLQIVNERTKDKDFYVDIDVELLNYFKMTYREEMKKFITKLNSDLQNIASYSLGFKSTDPEIRDFYLQNLVKKIEACDLTAAPPKKAAAAKGARRAQVKTVINYYRIPFLIDSYKKLQENTDKLVKENQKELEQLSVAVFRLKLAVLYKVSAEQAEKLREKIINGEKYLLGQLKAIFDPVIEEAKKTLGSLYNKPEIQHMLSQDLLTLVSLDLAAEQLNDDTLDIFKTICLMMSDICDKDLCVLYSTACILEKSLKTQTLHIFYVVNISNFNVTEINDFRKSHSEKKENKLYYNYSNMDSFVNYCQERLIPEFGDPKMNLKVFREKYQNLIDRLKHDKEERAARTGATNELSESDPNIYNFMSLINLFGLLDILPQDQKQKYFAALKEIKNQKQRFGTDSHLEFVRGQLLKIFNESGHIKDINSKNYCLVLSEHIMINVPQFNFELFLEDKYDLLFSRFSQEELEKICCTLGWEISKQIPDFYSLETLKKTLTTIENEHEFKEYNRLLMKLNINKKRCHYFVVSLVDYLYIKGLNLASKPYEKDFIPLVDFILKNADFSKEYKSLRNIILISLLRVLFSSDIIQNVIPKNAEIREYLEASFIENSRAKDYFLGNPQATPFTYFVQSVVREYGDMVPYQPLLKTISNVSALVLDEDSQGTITFFDKEMRDYFLKLRDDLDDACYKKDSNKMTHVWETTYKGNSQTQKYMIGVALINKFINSVKKVDESLVASLREAYLSTLCNMSMGPNLQAIYRLIISGKALGYNKFLSSETGELYNIRLSKTFLQYLLISVVYFEMGYNYDGWKEWKTGIATDGFKAKIVSTESMSNMSGIFENIIHERILSGSYQDYGDHLRKNLGIYKCSCGYFYSIGNCGYAVQTSLCPKCGQQIGGANHEFLHREGHIHIKTLEEMTGYFQKEFDNNYKAYNMHLVVNSSSLDLIPPKLFELGFMKLLPMATTADKQEVKLHQTSFYFRHLIDHMYLTGIPELLNTESKKLFDTQMSQIVNYNSKSIKELYGTMSGKSIAGYMEYFLAHVKNDIEQLSKDLYFENPVDIFDWLRAVFTKLIERMHEEKQPLSTKPEQILRGELITAAQQILIDQETNVHSMVAQSDTMKSVLKNVFFRKINGDLLYTFNDKFKEESHFIYQFCRHNKYERSKVIAEFNKQLERSEHSLLKKVVRYHFMLKDFPKIVMANLALSYYLMNNYDRIYTFEDALELDIQELNDPKLKELFEDFRHVWTAIIPKHAEGCPEVFSFAYLCHRNIDIDKFVKDLLAKGGAKFGKLIFTNSKDYEAKELMQMISIIETFIQLFHNKIVEEINKVLEIEKDDYETTLPEFCDEGSFVTDFDYLPIVEKNFWYSTSNEKENLLGFDLKKIEYLCAKAMRKKYVRFEEKERKYYCYKGINIKDNEKLLKSMFEKIVEIPMDPTQKAAIEQYDESEVYKSYDFMMEIGEYIYQSFMFYDNQVSIKSIIMDIKSAILRKRFSSYDEKLHSKLRIGNLHEYFDLIKQKRFDFTFNKTREHYSKPVGAEIRQEFSRLLKDSMVSSEDLAELKVAIKDNIRENYDKGPGLYHMKISDQVLLDEISPCFGFMSELLFEQYLEICELLDDAIRAKQKNVAVKRTSSKIESFERRSSKIIDEKP